MLSYIIALFAVPALFIAWFLFQNWLSKIDNSYKGYKAGCGGCTRSCSKKPSQVLLNKGENQITRIEL